MNENNNKQNQVQNNAQTHNTENQKELEKMKEVISVESGQNIERINQANAQNKNLNQN